MYHRYSVESEAEEAPAACGAEIHKCAAEEGVYCSLFDIRSMIICFMNFCRVSFDKSPSLVAVDSAMCVGM